MHEAGRRKILLVEDEAAITPDNARILRRFGYDVVTACSGEEAVSLSLGDPSIGLVLMDLELDGRIDAAAAAGRILEKRTVPIVFLTPNSDPEIMERVRGITRYGGIPKNSGSRELGSSIEAVFELFEADEKAGKRIEDSLIKSEALLKEMGRLAKIGGWRYDKETGELQWTEEVYSIFEYDPSNKPMLDSAISFYSPEHAPLIKKAIDNLMQTGEPFDLEVQIRTKKGNSRWVRTIARPIYTDGKISGRAGTIQDISARKETEILFHREQERLRNLVAATGVGNWEWNLLTGESFVDERAAAILGYRPEEFSACDLDSWLKLEHPDDLRNAENLLNGNLRGETDFFSFESRMKHKNGSWIWVFVRGQVIERDENGRPVRLFIVHMDITERKRAETTLRVSEEKYRHLIENSHDIIYTLSPGGIFTFVSPAWTAFLGHSVDRVEGRSFQLFVHPEDLPACKEALEKVISTGRRLEGIEYRVRHLDGTWRWHTTNALPVKDASGAIIGFEGMARDVTERKRAEEKIEALLQQKDILLKEVHHRIKNNMNVMSSLLSLQIAALKDSEASSVLQDAKSRLHSMGMLYEKLYRSENIRALSVKDYLQTLITDLVRLFSSGKEIRIADHLEEFNLDVKEMSSLGIIVNEIVTNAMKYAFNGKDTGEIAITAFKKDKLVTVIVEDDGIGLPETITIEESPGFGLMLVGTLAKQLNGSVRIERDRGTKFRLEFEP